MKKIIIFSIVFISISVLMNSCSSEIEYDYSYEKTVNQYGVISYYLEGKLSPPFDIDENRNIIDYKYINKTLSVIGEKNIASSMNYEKHGTAFHSWKDYKGSYEDIRISYGTCKQERFLIDDIEYTCIKRIKLFPNRLQRMRYQGKNNNRMMFVEKKEYGEKWPFVIDEGLIRCNIGDKVFLITKNREHYGLNGLAIADERYKDGREILDKRGITSSDFIIMGRGKTLSDFISMGLNLCK